MEEDAHFVPIMYAMEASLSMGNQSNPVVEGGSRVKIDQSQLNNLTRFLEANNTASKRFFGNGPTDSNGTLQINNTLYNQL